MTVDGMRRVDRWLGVPLCFLLSLAERLVGRLWQRPRPERIRKILFVQLSEMGSSISAYSALLKARALCPGAELHYFIFEEMQEAIRLLEVVPEENIHTVRSRSAGMLVRDCLAAVVRLRRLHIDAVLDLELFSRISALLSYLFGCPVRVGFDRFYMEGLYRGCLQTHPVIYNHTRHISRNFLALALALTGEPGRQPLARAAVRDDDIRVPQRRSSPEQCARMRTRVQSLCPGIDSGSVIILLNPNSSALLPLRRWPLENYIALARRLLEHPRVHVLVTGAAEEEAEAARLCASMRRHVK